MYQQRANGGFRARASFPIDPALIGELNVICEATGLSFAAVCRRACELLARRYVAQGHFVREPAPWPPVFEDTRPQVRSRQAGAQPGCDPGRGEAVNPAARAPASRPKSDAEGIACLDAG